MLRILSLLTLLAFVTLPVSDAAAAKKKRTPATGLTSAEGKLADRVNRLVPDALLLLERAVNQNSGTMNLAGVKAVGALYTPEFDALGFRTRWVEGAAFGRAGHLIAERGSKGPKVVLIGHLDTVFEPSSPFQRFTRVDDSTATGPGVTDMKGGIGILLVTLRALKDAGELDKLRVTVVLTGDEEAVGTPLLSARADLVSAADGASAAIGFEDGDGDPQHVVVARRGSSRWKLRVRGTP